MYRGRLCKVVRDASVRCFTVVVTAQNGALSAAWTNRATNATAHASGSIAANGNATLAIDAFDAKGEPIVGKLSGRIADNTITLSGTWSDGTVGNASLVWAPDAAAATPGHAAPGGGRRSQK